MLQSLFSGISGLSTHQQLLNVVANNLSNVNTMAFKGSRAVFQDVLSQTYQAPTQSTALQGGSNGIQIGLGVSLGTVTSVFSQGSLQSTGVPTDLAIEGDGFLVVRDPASPAGSGYFYTRAGALTLDSAGNLIDSAGFRVQGYQVPDQSAPVAPTAGDPIVDLVIAPDATQTSPMIDFIIESTGRVLMHLEDGSIVPAAYITMNDFSNPEGLLKVGRNHFEETPAASVMFTGYQSPGSSGMGKLRSGFLELANVDLGREFTEMIRSQRGLQANSRTITTSDEILQELINIKR